MTMDVQTKYSFHLRFAREPKHTSQRSNQHIPFFLPPGAFFLIDNINNQLTEGKEGSYIDKEKLITNYKNYDVGCKLIYHIQFWAYKILPCISTIIISGSLKNERMGGILQLGLTA